MDIYSNFKREVLQRVRARPGWHWRRRRQVCPLNYETRGCRVFCCSSSSSSVIFANVFLLRKLERLPWMLMLGIGGQSHVFVSWKLICHKMSYSVFVQIMFHAWACGRWCGAEKIFNLVFFRVEFFEDIYFNIFKTTVLPNLKLLCYRLSFCW